MLALRFLAFATRFCDTGWYWPESRSVPFDWNDWPGTFSTSSSVSVSELEPTGPGGEAAPRAGHSLIDGDDMDFNISAAAYWMGYELDHVQPERPQHTGFTPIGNSTLLDAPRDS